VSHKKNLIIQAFFLFGYLFYFLGHAVFALCVIPLFIVLFPLGKRRRYAFIAWIFTRYVHFLSQVYLPFMRVYRISEISGREHLEKSMPAIVVANHRSRMDAPLLMSPIPTTAVMIKSSYARNMLYAGFVKYLDFISIDQSSLSALASAIDRAKTLIGSRKSLLVFPEGGRAPGGKLMPFKDIAFRIAQQVQAPIVPAVIHSTLPFMAKRPGSIFPGMTFNFTIRFLPPVSSEPGERPADFAERVRLLIINELKTLDAGTEWES
jgi:1-acyl-sn-glycerol-3-phosphate acyltransferase